MKILISGASGYIGTSLINSLIKDGLRPGAISRTGTEIPYVDSTAVDVYVADISRPFDMKLKDKYDFFIHLAAANDIDSVNPETAIMSTAFGTRNCLDFCRKNEIKNFIYFSTFQVLGKVEGDIDENTIPEPKNDYGITHYFAEEYVKMFKAASGINYIILRPTNIYGAPIGKIIDRWSLVPNCLCKEAYEKESITLLSSGKQMRDFLHLSDLVNVTKLSLKKFGQFQNKIINVSSGNDFTIFEIAELVKNRYEKKFNKKCKLIVKSELPLETNKYNINRELITQFNFNFSKKNSIIEEINSIFNLFKTN